MAKPINEKWKLSRCIISTLLTVWRHVWISSVQKFLSQQSDNLTTPQSHDATISPGRCCPSHSTARTAPVSPSRDPQESPAHIRMCFYKGCSCIAITFCSFQWSTVTLKWWYNDLNCPGKVRVDTPSIGIEVAEKIVWVSLTLWYFYWPTDFEAWFRNLQSLPVAIQKSLAQGLVLKCEVSKHLPMSF